MGEITAKFSVCKWQVGDLSPIAIAVTSVTETGGNRIVEQERSQRDGAKLDDTGSKVRQWSLTAIFQNGIEEPGIEENPAPLYPRMLQLLINSFDRHETGTLTLPTVGEVRARAVDYTRRDSPELDDGATLDLVFKQDNEDALDRAVLEPPTVQATVLRLAEQTTFSAQKSGTWSDGVADLKERAAEIQGLLRAPGRASADVAAAVRSHRRTVQAVVDTAEEVATEEDGLFADPRGSETARQFRLMLDREAAAEDERVRSRPRTRAFVVDVERTSIFEIAARFDQDAEELLDLNAARVSDPFAIRRDDVVRIFESAAR